MYDFGFGWLEWSAALFSVLILMTIMIQKDWIIIFQSSSSTQKDWKMIFQSSWIMIVIRISTENRAADHSNQPNPKSYALRKLALDKENILNNGLLCENLFFSVPVVQTSMNLQQQMLAQQQGQQGSGFGLPTSVEQMTAQATSVSDSVSFLSYYFS